MKKEVSYLLKVIHDGFRAKIDAQLKSFDMTVSQSRVLHFIRDSGGVTTQKKIEEFLEVSHPTVVGLLSRMMKSGYIECGYDDEHGKNKIVRETQKAVSFSNEMDNFFERANEKLTEGLSEEEKNELARLLGVLYENVRK
ncbi:MAG: MarR family winged helix-turn-helix transcriptional regulator [Acutalibacteraceae bacterium]